MSAKHTPGPWSVAAPEGKYYGTDVLDANGKRVCECWTHDASCGTLSAREESAHHFQNDDERKEWMCDSHYETARDYENARLIAASPGLLEACKAFEEWAEAGSFITSSFCEFCVTHAPKNQDGEISGPINHRPTCALALARAATAKAEGTAP